MTASAPDSCCRWMGFYSAALDGCWVKSLPVAPSNPCVCPHQEHIHLCISKHFRDHLNLTMSPFHICCTYLFSGLVTMQTGVCDPALLTQPAPSVPRKQRKGLPERGYGLHGGDANRLSQSDQPGNKCHRLPKGLQTIVATSCAHSCQRFVTKQLGPLP